ncbi:MAG: hypothetical protein IPM35_39490 [Myxococcales bacterium]|nr:hypothetical protein [Myxococcales bacterium]
MCPRGCESVRHHGTSGSLSTCENRAELRAEDGGRFGLSGLGEYGAAKRRASLWAADKALRLVFHTYAWCGGLHDYHLPNMNEVADAAMPHYNNDLRGGEGHMEVGKLILNVVKQKATMTLSVKPFGCMPSGSVSDGVQSLITERYPGTIYCAVETSGDGAVNFYSRVQMYLFKARQAAEAEVASALAANGLDGQGLRAFLAAHPRLSAALHRSPHAGACTATDLVHEAAYLKSTPLWRRAARRLDAGARARPGASAEACPRCPRQRRCPCVRSPSSARSPATTDPPRWTRPWPRPRLGSSRWRSA